MRIVMWFVLGVLGLFVMGCGLMLAVTIGLISSNEFTDSTVTVETTPTPTPTPIPISVGMLIQEYEANEVAAKAKYEDRYVEITGEIDSITNSFDSNYVVLNPPGNSFTFTSVHCQFRDANIPQFIPLKSGQTATFRGYVSGMGAFDIGVRNCSVVNDP